MVKSFEVESWIKVETEDIRLIDDLPLSWFKCVNSFSTVSALKFKIKRKKEQKKQEKKTWWSIPSIYYTICIWRVIINFYCLQIIIIRKIFYIMIEFFKRFMCDSIFIITIKEKELMWASSYELILGLISLRVLKPYMIYHLSP